MLLRYSAYAYVSGMGLYAVSAALFVIGAIFEKEKASRAGFAAICAAVCAHAASVVSMWVAVGHGPYMTRFEVLSSHILVAAAMFVACSVARPWIRKLGPVAAVALLVAAGFVFFLPRGVLPIAPSLRSSWLVVHIMFAKLAVGSFLLAFCISCHHAAGYRSSRFPEGAVFKFTLSGFVFMTVMIVAGAIWANESWGRYWSFDPIETWSLCAWLLYGIYIHLKLTLGWSGRRLALFNIAVFLLAIVSFFLIPVITKTLHSAYMINS